MTNELKQYFDDTFSVLTGNKNKVDDELLKDNDHTFTLQTGTRVQGTIKDLETRCLYSQLKAKNTTLIK